MRGKSADSTGDGGYRYLSIYLGSDDFARLSYYDNTSNNRDLKFVRCTNNDCTNKNITSADTTGDVGQFSSMALGSDGYARISYYDNSGGILNFCVVLILIVRPVIKPALILAETWVNIHP